MIEKRKKPYVFAVAVIVILFGAAIGLYILNLGQKTVMPIQKLRLANGDFLGSAQIYVALEKGHFKEEGLDVSLLPSATGRQALDTVLAGKADLATVADMPIALEVLKGTKLSVICTLHSTPKMYGIAARKDRGISSPGDFRDKTIGVMPGTNTVYTVESFLLFHGVPRDGIRLVNLTVQGIVDALLKGDIQAGVLWQPFLSDVLSQLGSNAVIFYGDEQRIYKMTWNLAGAEEFVHGKPDIVKRLLRALLKADTFIRENPKETRQITAGHLDKSDSASFDEFWKSYVPDVSLSPLLIENMENQARWAVRNKLTDRKDMPNYLRSIYFDGLESVKREAVTIVH